MPVYQTMQADNGVRTICAITFRKAVRSKTDEFEHILCCCEVIIAWALDPRIKLYLLHYGINMNDGKRWICTDYTTSYETKVLA